MLLIVGIFSVFYFGQKETGLTKIFNINSPFGNVPNQNVMSEQVQSVGVSDNTVKTFETGRGIVLEKIVSSPVAGFLFLKSGTSTSIRYAEKGTGKINDVNLFGDKVISQKVVADTQTKVVSAYFFKTGLEIIRFKENEDGSFSGLYSLLSASTTAPSKTIEDIILFLDRNVAENKAISVVQNGNGSIITMTDPGGTNAKKIWESSLQEITVQPLNGDLILMQTKPALGLTGSSFIISSSIATPYLSGASGFKVLSNPDSQFAVFSDYANTKSPMQVFDKKLNKKWDLFINTLPEKCVWSKKQLEIVFCFEFSNNPANLPNDWYFGKIALETKALWEISAKTSQESVLIDFSSVGEKIDITNPTFSADEKIIGFINKIDGSLWIIDLTNLKN